MFGAHPEPMDMVSEWFLAALTQQPSKLPHTNATGFSPAVVEVLKKIDQPGGASEIASRPTRPDLPENTVHLLGYEHLQGGDAKGAMEIFKLNVSAHPGLGECIRKFVGRLYDGPTEGIGLAKCAEGVGIAGNGHEGL